MLDRALGGLRVDPSDALRRSALCDRDQPALDRHQLRGRQLAALGPQNILPYRKPAAALDEDLHPGTLPSLLRQCSKHGAMIERVLKLGQAPRSGQPVRDVTLGVGPVHQLAPWPAFERGQRDTFDAGALVPVKAMLGSACLDLVAPPAGLDPVLLA